MTRSVLSTAFAFIALSTAPGFGCEQFAFPPVGRVPEFNHAVGVVRGHIVREIGVDGVGVAPGVIVDIVESSGTFSGGARLEIFPLAVGIGCEPLARDPTDFEKQYPAGAKVSVAWRMDDEASQTVVLEGGSFGSLARVPESVPRVSHGCLDFKSFREVYEPNGHAFSLEIAWRNAHRGWFEDHELLRCYVLVDAITDVEERRGAFRNLAFYRTWYEARNTKLAEGLYGALLRQHGVPRYERKPLMKNFRASRQAG